MRCITSLLTAACMLAAFCPAAVARIDPAIDRGPVPFPRENLRATAAADSFFNDLHIGALWFPSVSNKGYIGYWDISAFYPGGGDQSNLWQAGMWAGGYVEGGSNAWFHLGSDGNNSDPSQYDTRDEQAIVETEDDLGLTYPYRRITIHVDSADKPYSVSSGDTLDGDTGMDVEYEWHQWGVPGYDHWVFVHVTIAFSKAIDQFYWGWMSDCDVGDVDVPSMYYDDYAGWDGTYGFAYMRDWDYDPLPGDTLWLSPDVIGQVLLAAPPAGGPVDAEPVDTQRWTSKNYWDWTNDASSVQDRYDRLSGTWENPFPSDHAFDYRILTGVGPYAVSADDTAHFWMAYVVGEGFDEDSHAMYELGTLVDHVQDAHAFFEAGMAIPPPAVPPRAPDLDPDLETDVTGDEIRVHWAPYSDITGGAAADSFIVHTSTVGKLGPWERVDAYDVSVTEMQLQLAPNVHTYIWVQAYDVGNGVGSNPFALTSRLYQRDEDGILRADQNTITSVVFVSTGGTTMPRPDGDLFRNHPNPFNPSTTITYTVSSAGEVRLRIYDIAGRLVRVLVNDTRAAGKHRVYWNGLDERGAPSASGVYLVKLETPGRSETIKIVLLR